MTILFVGVISKIYPGESQNCRLLTYLPGRKWYIISLIFDNFDLPERPLNPSRTNITGGVLNNVNVELRQIEVHKVG